MGRLQKQKADVAEHPRAFDHVGLLFNEPPRHGRFALYSVIRRLQLNHSPEQASDEVDIHSNKKVIKQLQEGKC